jgi:uncharacterized protein
MVTNTARHKRAFTDMLKSARIGHRDAQYEVGLMYANGVGVDKDIEQAILWIRQSAEKGLATAQYLLATRYANGIGVPRDGPQALMWYLKAAQQGHVKALFRLGKLQTTGQPEMAAAYFTQAAELGLAEAQCALGHHFEAGLGVVQDAEQAAFWYSQSAAQGWAPAHCALAAMYSTHQLGAPNLLAARDGYRMAVQLGSPVAFVALDTMDAQEARLIANAAAHGQISQSEPSNCAGRSKKANAKARRRAGTQERRRDADRWEKAADSGDADALYHLGLMYERGLGVVQDTARAQVLFQQAAQLDHAHAQTLVATGLEANNPAMALAMHVKSAKAGNAAAQFALGRIYSAGQIVPQDFLKGLSWYAQAGVAGDANALMALADQMRHGVDHWIADCLQEAATEGNVQAQWLWGEALMSTHTKQETAARWIEKSAMQGLADAQCALGGLYSAGRGVPKDMTLAFDWYQKAANQGHAKAQWNLGSIYASGRAGQKQDLTLAFEWCQKGADGGFVPAQSTLGVLYTLVKNPLLATTWWAKAANAGDPEAQYNLAQAYAKGEGVAKDAVVAFDWFLKAACQGIAGAQARLGLMYATGQGVALDAIEAHKWFVLAAQGQEPSAVANLARSEALLSTAQLLEARRRAVAFSG